MNCRHFQNLLYEYVEGSLSANTQAAADKHLAGCNACRQAVRKEQQFAQLLSDRFRQGTETLALRSDVRHRILTAPQCASAPQTIVGLWNRFAWPLGIAASLLIVAAILLVNHSPRAQVDDIDALSAVSVQVSYRVPTCKFREEGNLVLDTMSYETVDVSETLWTRKPIQEKQEKKTPL